METMRVKILSFLLVVAALSPLLAEEQTKIFSHADWNTVTAN